MNWYGDGVWVAHRPLAFDNAAGGVIPPNRGGGNEFERGRHVRFTPAPVDDATGRNQGGTYAPPCLLVVVKNSWGQRQGTSLSPAPPSALPSTKQGGTTTSESLPSSSPTPCLLPPLLGYLPIPSSSRLSSPPAATFGHDMAPVVVVVWVVVAVGRW